MVKRLHPWDSIGCGAYGRENRGHCLQSHIHEIGISEFPVQAVFFGIAIKNGIDKEIRPVGGQLSL